MSVTSYSEDLLLQVFNELSLPSVSNDWTNQVWQNDFCESHDLPDCIEAGIEENDWYRTTLTKALRACREYSHREWSDTSNRSSSETSEKGNYF